jgi:uncharacterized repeat protein (TIGR03833 family)
MTSEKLSDPRYRVNIEIGLRVMIKEENNLELVPCYVKEIITRDVKHESGIKVICEKGKTGRVKHIGNESSFMDSNDLLVDLERKLRKIIVKELSIVDPSWWENLSPTIKDDVQRKLDTGGEQRKQLGIPDYELIEYTNFYHLPDIILGKRWQYFEKIFKNKNSIDIKLHELAQIRNPSAHSNILPEMIERKIQVYYDDIVRLIEDYQRK